MMRVSGSEREEEMRKRSGVRDISTPLRQQSGLRRHVRCNKEGKGRVGRCTDTQHNTISPSVHVRIATSLLSGEAQNSTVSLALYPRFNSRLVLSNVSHFPSIRPDGSGQGTQGVQTHPPYLPIVDVDLIQEKPIITNAKTKGNQRPKSN